MTAPPDLRQSEFAVRRRFGLRVPEGLVLEFELAGLGDRIAAFLIDLLWIAVTLLGILILGIPLGMFDLGLGTSVLSLGIFVLRNGWWTLHELRSGGTTPGKRRLQLRVIDSRGGTLRPLQLVVRNLTRELELFLPIVVLCVPSQLVGQGPQWVRLLSSLWLLGFLLPPLIDRRGRRVGDLLAGTVVIREARHELGRELVTDQVETATTPQFSEPQLARYGIYELQVLERLLREEPHESEVLRTVAGRISAKIGWHGRIRDAGGARPFLEAFYRAQRDRLEHDLTLGRAREDKHDRRSDR